MTDWRGFALSITALCVLVSMISKGFERVGKVMSRHGEEIGIWILAIIGSLVLVVCLTFGLISLLADVANGYKTLWVVSLWRWVRRLMDEGARGGKGFFKW